MILKHFFSNKSKIVTKHYFGISRAYFSTRVFKFTTQDKGSPMEANQKAVPLDKYDVIGFDLDNTLCSYRLDNLSSMIYTLLANYLTKVKKYDPKFLLKSYEAEKSFIQKGLILDKNRGNILKFSEHFKIIKGYHGSRELSKEELAEIYGPNLTWKEIHNIADVISSKQYRQAPYFAFIDYFVTSSALICARIVDSLDVNNRPESYTFWPDVYDAFVYIFTNQNTDRACENSECENYFDALKSNPSLYVNKCSEDVKSWLVKIGQTKIMFVLTNSDIDYASFLTEFCLGKNWKNYFDIIISSGEKPGFFKLSTNFVLLEGLFQIREIDKENLLPYRIYSGGNWSDLYFLLKKMSTKEAPQVLYFGDSIGHDIVTPSIYSECHTAAIVEEYNTEKSCLPNNEDNWGSFFSEDVNGENDNPENVKSLWFSIIKKYSQFSIHSLDSLASLTLADATETTDQ